MVSVAGRSATSCMADTPALRVGLNISKGWSGVQPLRPSTLSLAHALFRDERGRVGRAIVFQGELVDLAVELHIDALAVGHLAELVVRPVVIARIVEAEEFDAVAGAVDDGDVAVIGRE